MKNEFVPFELAVKLKAIGFNEPCLASYYVFGNGRVIDGRYGQTEPELFVNGIGKQLEDRIDELEMFAYHDTSAPTFSQAFRLFREKHDVRHNIMDFIDDETGIEWDYEIATIGTDLDENGYYKPLVEYSLDDDNNRKFKTYEEAELACLNKLIEIVEL